jgi:hypothetical protein
MVGPSTRSPPSMSVSAARQNRHARVRRLQSQPGAREQRGHVGHVAAPHVADEEIARERGILGHLAQLALEVVHGERISICPWRARRRA